MLKNNKSIFICTDCGNEFLRWEGKCSACGAWNTLKEVKAAGLSPRIGAASRGDSQPMAFVKIKEVAHKRLSTGSREFDQVLGGGLVPGSIVLLAGEPGIGKSTLLLHLCQNLKNVLYVSGEESAGQLKMRWQRLGLKNPQSQVLTETDVDRILAVAEEVKPQLLIIDSIQTVYDSRYPSTPGSIAQVKESALRFQQWTKSASTATILVGHLTKEGAVAGPKALEHLVDIVLYLEGERFENLRILRGAKNRFGSIDEVGIFQMQEKGLVEVPNPSAIFMPVSKQRVPGSVIFAAMEGSRPILVEVQALTTPTIFGYPRRTASGIDFNRLQLIIAILQKRAGLNLGNQDVFINVAGGLKISEPAADLAVALAIASVFKNQPVDSGLCVFGELGLSGDIKPVRFNEKRLHEARRLGLKKFISEKNILQALKNNLILERR